MKKIITTFVLLSSYIWATSISPDKITKMINEIKEERRGIDIKKLDLTVNPFTMVEVKKREENLTKEKPIEIKKEVTVEKIYKLEAILNHAVFINNKWYKKGDKIDFYKLVYIGKDSVTLQSSQGRKVLSLKKKKHIKLH